MPKPTFDRLPPKKRERFVDAALSQFASRPYDQASVSAMIAELGIAKGSFYQYFEDKLDLFRWLVEEAGRRKVAAIAASAVEPSFFGRLAESYAAGLRFVRAHPRWARVALRAREPSKEPRLEVIRRSQDEASHRWLRDLVVTAIDAGELRAGLDPDVTAHLVHGVSSEGLLRAWLGSARLDVTDLDDGPDLVRELDDGRMERIIAAAIDLLRHGLAAGEA